MSNVYHQGCLEVAPSMETQEVRIDTDGTPNRLRVDAQLLTCSCGGSGVAISDARIDWNGFTFDVKCNAPVRLNWSYFTVD